NVLFLCTGNSARSILAEGVLNRRDAELDGQRVLAHSAGSQPTGKVHPDARALLQDRAWQFDAQRSKSWDEFRLAPHIDWVITLCGQGAEGCPVFPGRAQRQHWPLPDPASGAASFPDTLQAIEQRVDAFLDELGASPISCRSAPR
ncbi:MAG: arsenate reductase ArsC, partial [Pseudomonadales bacterium]|nr:arsenate reductase ArsC [Pseudomonadales bacterium]